MIGSPEYVRVSPCAPEVAYDANGSAGQFLRAVVGTVVSPFSVDGGGLDLDSE
jgi:hypothetical protein